MPPHNEGDQIDYMAEEGDMSDFADDVDGEENNGGDRNLDDYDMVSLIPSHFSAFNPESNTKMYL